MTQKIKGLHGIPRSHFIFVLTTQKDHLQWVCDGENYQQKAFCCDECLLLAVLFDKKKKEFVCPCAFYFTNGESDVKRNKEEEKKDIFRRKNQSARGWHIRPATALAKSTWYMVQPFCLLSVGFFEGSTMYS
jgi:hypothetical protein